MTGLACAIDPTGAPMWFAESVIAAGGVIVPVEQAEALFWFSAEADGLSEVLERGTALRWVQLVTAGVEPFSSLIDDRYAWTCAKGVYADAVAEHALALTLAGFRNLAGYARRSEWSEQQGTNLYGAKVVILGGGGIANSMVGLLEAFSARVIIVRRHPQPMRGVEAVVAPDQLHTTLEGADLVVVALALTAETRGIVGERELRAMPDHAWLINVARGAHVATDALVDALRDGGIGGAGLDVTDPEPLPADHPLWTFENCIITPHTANTPAMLRPRLAAFVRDNVANYVQGRSPRGLVDAVLRY